MCASGVGVELVRGYSPEINTAAAEVCRCGLPTRPPEDGTWWRPDLDADPGVRVHAVVRYGDKPELRRVERLENNAGWSERGAMVDFYSDRTPPMFWSGVGHCWANTPHPVVPVREDADGSWDISA
jgi:hypothetical protein